MPRAVSRMLIGRRLLKCRKRPPIGVVVVFERDLFVLFDKPIKLHPLQSFSRRALMRTTVLYRSAGGEWGGERCWHLWRVVRKRSLEWRRAYPPYHLRNTPPPPRNPLSLPSCMWRVFCRRLQVHEEKQVLILGTMGSGTAQMSRELARLGMEVGHEASDSVNEPCRDGTISWAHAIRFLR